MDGMGADRSRVSAFPYCIVRLVASWPRSASWVMQWGFCLFLLFRKNKKEEKNETSRKLTGLSHVRILDGSYCLMPRVNWYTLGIGCWYVAIRFRLAACVYYVVYGIVRYAFISIINHRIIYCRLMLFLLLISPVWYLHTVFRRALLFLLCFRTNFVF